MRRGSSKRRHRAEGGVSLLEMLVAMAIFAIIASLLYGTFSRTAGARRYVEERAAVYSLARSSISWLERDIEAAFSAHTYPVGEHRFNRGLIDSLYSGDHFLEGLGPAKNRNLTRQLLGA